MSNTVHLPPKAFQLVKAQKAWIDKAKAKAAESTQRATHSALVSLTAAGLGYGETRYQRTEFGGAKTSLLVAIVGHTAALVGPNAYADMAAAVGDGGLAVMAYQYGRDTGARHRNESNNTAPQLR